MKINTWQRVIFAIGSVMMFGLLVGETRIIGPYFGVIGLISFLALAFMSKPQKGKADKKEE